MGDPSRVLVAAFAWPVNLAEGGLEVQVGSACRAVAWRCVGLRRTRSAKVPGPARQAGPTGAGLDSGGHLYTIGIAP